MKTFLAGLGGASAAIIGVVIVFFLCCFSCFFFSAIGSSSNEPSTNNNPASSTVNNPATAQPIVNRPTGPQEGDVLAGPTRQEIENEYNKQEEQSKLKADAYVTSIKGKQIIWVGSVSNIDEELFGDGYEVTMKMKGYTVTVQDPAMKYGDLRKGQLVKVTGNIDSVSSFLGMIVDINNATIEVL